METQQEIPVYTRVNQKHFAKFQGRSVTIIGKLEGTEKGSIKVQPGEGGKI